jgi:hypothetical protein
VVVVPPIRARLDPLEGRHPLLDQTTRPEDDARCRTKEVRTGAFRLGDGQSDRRLVSHNERVTRFFHRQLTDVVSAMAGEVVTPSYVYVAAYQEGAELPPHTDREQCEFSVTLLVDHSPEPAHESPWPLHPGMPQGTVTVFQAPGDALLYRGRPLRHWRTPRARGSMSTSIFFHYVRAGFTGPLD